MGNIDEQRKLIALRLRNARESRKLTQAQLSDKLSERGVSMGPSTIAKIETGRRGLEIAEALAMVDALDLRWQDLDIKPERGGPSRAERLKHQAVALVDDYVTAVVRAENAASTLMDIVAEMMTLETGHRLDSEKGYAADKKIAEAMRLASHSVLRFYEAEIALGFLPEPEVNDETGEIVEDFPFSQVGVLPLHMRMMEQPWPVDPDSPEYGEG